MLVHWVAALGAWLLGVAVQLQQRSVGDGRWGLALPVLCLLLAGLLAWQRGTWRRGWRGALLVCLCLASAGWGQAQWRAAQRLAQVWPEAWSQRAVMLTGRIDAMPQQQAWGRRVEVEVLSVQEIGTPGASADSAPRQWQAGDRWRLPGMANHAVLPERVSLSWGSPTERSPRARERQAHDHDAEPDDVPPQAALMPGQVWRWTVMLQAPDGLVNPGGFDSERWMFEHALRAQGKVVTRGTPPPALLRPASTWSPGMIDRWRTHLRERIRAHVDDARVAGLIAGLTIGEQSAIGADDWDALRDTGTAHLAAISRHQKHNSLVF